MQRSKPVQLKKKRDTKTIIAVLITVLVCATLSAVGYFHVVTVRKSYLKGVSDGMNIKDVQDIQAILNN